STIGLYSLNDGKELQRIEARGCGGAQVTITLKKALVSQQYCTPPPDKVGVDATSYDYSTTPPTFKDLTAPDGGASLHDFVLSPDGKQVALTSQMSTGTPGPGLQRKSTGFWLLDIGTSAFKKLAPGTGPEQYVISWSQDGRYILGAT